MDWAKCRNDIIVCVVSFRLCNCLRFFFSSIIIIIIPWAFVFSLFLLLPPQLSRSLAPPLVAGDDLVKLERLFREQQQQQPNLYRQYFMYTKSICGFEI